MKKLSVLLMFVSLMVSGCKEYDYPLNYFNYDNKEYELNKGVMVYVGEMDENIHQFQIYLTSLGINTHTFEGTGNYIVFNVYSSSSSILTDGNYVYDTSMNKDTFDDAYFYLNYKWEPEEDDDVVVEKEFDYEGEIKSGTIWIEKDGDAYDISFDCKTSDGADFKVYFNGYLRPEKL